MAAKIESLVLRSGRKNPQDCLLHVSGLNSCGNTSEKANIHARADGDKLLARGTVL
jgi:hypothetical protein